MEILVLVTLVLPVQVSGQHTLEFAGQLSTVANYSPDNQLDVLLGGRYIPELNYSIILGAANVLDFDGSVNIYGSVSFLDIDSLVGAGNVRPYRLWARFTGKRVEIRAGLQKIDFGSAVLLRPLQWFNQIDPRDPLQLTYGVYGVLGRYYFRNNANIWLWVLYGNEETRGLDALKTYNRHPEFGGRVQYPVPKGEIAVSYNHRTADSRDMITIAPYDQIPEEKCGVDGKWDVEIGLWFEFCFIHRAKDIGILTNQTLLTLGVDYTFGIGNGLNVVAEHLITSSDRKPFAISNTSNISASSVSYPLGLFDNLSSMLYYNWSSDGFSFFMNYAHQFNYVTGYIMAYYNTSGHPGLQQNEFIDSFSGPGIRLMLVYNH
ncbi:MAG: hypothetical protein D4R67_00570 [Bacteroidetes bacterium]|nr:MAG: hypothetical protein D4R67_00570 [Bacteroidota bacterium]